MRLNEFDLFLAEMAGSGARPGRSGGEHIQATFCCWVLLIRDLVESFTVHSLIMLAKILLDASTHHSQAQLHPLET